MRCMARTGRLPVSPAPHRANAECAPDRADTASTATRARWPAACRWRCASGRCAPLPHRRQAERHHLLRARREDAAFEPVRARRHAAPRHVLGEGGQQRQRLLDALDARRDEGAGAVPLHEESAAHQILHRLAHGDARHVANFRDIALGRQRVARLQCAVSDRLLDAFCGAADRRGRSPKASNCSEAAFRAASAMMSHTFIALPNIETAIATAPPSALPCGGRSRVLKGSRQARRVDAASPPSRQKGNSSAEIERAKMFLQGPRRRRRRSSRRHAIAPVGMFEHHRRESAEIAGLGFLRELDQRAGIVAESGKNLARQIGCLADAVIGEQRLLQQRPAEARAAALVADREAPAADGRVSGRDAAT